MSIIKFIVSSIHCCAHKTLFVVGRIINDFESGPFNDHDEDLEEILDDDELEALMKALGSDKEVEESSEEVLLLESETPFVQELAKRLAIIRLPCTAHKVSIFKVIVCKGSACRFQVLFFIVLFGSLSL